MQLKVLSSSSYGNCYILHNEDEALIIEVGVQMRKVKQGLNFNLMKVVGAIVTHNHLDHCKGVKDALACGINVYATPGTHKGINAALKFAKHHRQIDIHPQAPSIRIGRFSVIAFDVKHDALQPCGFLINHEETGTVLFLTDTYYSGYTFRNVNNMIVEANYCQKILDERMANGESPDFLRNRIFQSHMSLATCKELLQANDLSQVNNIVLIHLSDSNSDAARFKKEVTELTGKTVSIAKPGLELNFSKYPF